MLIRPTTRPTTRTLRRAFTLLEVLVVVAIIVMLAGIGGYYFLQRYEEAKVSRAKADVRTLSGLVEQYNLRVGHYPTTIQELAAPGDGGSPYAPDDQLRDPWGNYYQVDATGTNHAGQSADVFTRSPKGQVIGNWGN
jgi:general secretion pathway protein G